MENKLINIDNFLKKFSLKRNYLKDSLINIETNENTYLPKEELENGWLYNLYRSYSTETRKLSEVESMALIGVGPAIEALLFIEIFKIKKLFCFDINIGVLQAARNNILNNLNDSSALSLTVEHSDLLCYLISNQIKVNIIYENLPNLRLSSNLLLGKGVTSASFYSEPENDNVPPLYDESMLRLHYRFLQQAKQCLLPLGKVICCIGARVPIDIIKNMFVELGYDFKIIYIGLIQQLSAPEVIDTYKEIEERTNCEFLFLPHNNKRIIKLIDEYAYKEETSLLFNKIKKIGYTATEAHLQLVLGRKIDHIGLIIEGNLVNSGCQD